MLTVSDKVGELRAVVHISAMSDDEKRAAERHLNTIMRMSKEAVERRRAEADGIKDRLRLAFPVIVAVAGVFVNVVTVLSLVGLGITAASILIGYWIADSAYATNVEPFVVWLFNHRVGDWFYKVLVACLYFCIPFLVVLSLVRSARMLSRLVSCMRRLVFRGRRLTTET